MDFKIVSDYQPTGDQPEAIDQLVDGLVTGIPYQTLLGVTGSGKTFTMANVIEKVQRPTLILSHNKTLAAQLYGEMKQFFPENAVQYFVSYYDYYQPEAYIPSSDTFLKAAQLIGVDPSDCEVFEDGQLGIQAAQSAGMMSVDVTPYYEITIGQEL